MANNKKIDISIVIVSYNTRDITRKCLACVEKYAADSLYEVIVVDNASKDGSADMIEKEFPMVRLVRLSENRGFAGGNIPGMEMAKGRYVLLLNSDAFLDDGTLNDVISYMDEHPKIGVLGCKLTDPDGSLQPSARMLPGPLNKILQISGLAFRYSRSKFFGRVDFSWWDHSTPREVGWVVGAFFLIRRETMDDIGPLDDRYFLYFEEIDFCLTARRAGWKVVFYPHASIIHLGGESAVKTGKKMTSRNRQLVSIRLTSEFRYYRKLYGVSYVFISANIEFLWYVIVYFRNIFRRSTLGVSRRAEAIMMLKLVATTLIKERLGKVSSDQ